MRIYNACNSDTQVFPTPVDIRQGSCNNNDNRFPSGQYSLCPIIEPGHAPAGLPPGPAGCAAETDASTALFADLSPPVYDPRQQTQLTAATSFSSEMSARLSEGTCIGDLSWSDTGWTMRWSDGAVDVRPGSDQQGITDSHTLAADPAATAQTARADITAIAHLHLTGAAIDFDADGNLVTVARSADVDISNKRSATGIGAGPVYTPPRLAAGAVAAGQRGDGSIPGYDPSLLPATHADTIRGRLLALYPRALVVSPGTESIDGVVVGESQSTTVSWTYVGGLTDAPRGEGTVPGSAAAASQPVMVQYDHAERLDAHRDAVDELVPLLIGVHTIYPDGHVEDETVTGTVAVSIYYAGLQTAV